MSGGTQDYLSSVYTGDTLCDIVERVRRRKCGEHSIERLTRGEQDRIDEYGAGCRVYSLTAPGRSTWSEAREPDFSATSEDRLALERARDRYKALQSQYKQALYWLELKGLLRGEHETLSDWQQRISRELEPALQMDCGPQEGQPWASGQPVPASDAGRRNAEFEASMQRANAVRERENCWNDRQVRPDIVRAIDGRIVEPIGAGVIPLVNAGFWIAFQGGAIDVTDRSEARLTAAFGELIKQLIDDGAVLIGRNSEGPDEPFPASNLLGLDLRYTDTVLAFPADLLSADELTTLSETDEARWLEAEGRRQFWDHQNRLQPGCEFGFIEFAFCPDGYVWNRHVNDKLFRAGRDRPLWTHIQVSREFIRAHWPFHLHANHSAAVLLDAYADAVKHYEDEGRRRSGLDRRAKQVEWIEPRLAAPAPKDRTHFRVSEIVERCVLDNDPAKRVAYFKAFELAVKDRFFNEGKCYRSRLFCTDTAAPFFMWLTKERLVTYLGGKGEVPTDAVGQHIDPADYRARRLERLAERVWMPRRFVRAWLDCYGLPAPRWLEDAAPAALSATRPDALQTEGATARGHLDAAWDIPLPHTPRVEAVRALTADSQPDAPPPVRRKAGRRETHDWDEATALLGKLWQTKGDPDIPDNQVEGWKSETDIWAAVSEHLGDVYKKRRQNKQDAPDLSWVRRKLKFEVERLRHNRQN